jgi:four helix bundle protein
MAVKSYRDLKVWEKAMDLVVESYRITKLLPKSEAYGLASQIQRAAVSIPANIAEGHGRDHLGDYLRHLSMAKGSVVELETHLLIARRLLYVTESDLEPVLTHTAEVGRMLEGLSKSLRKTQSPET